MPPEKRSPKRVVFIGAECTGKTTIANEIARRYDEPCSSEYVRQYVNALDRPLAECDLEPIARGQLRLEDEASLPAKHFVFHDTNLLSSILYAEHYFGAHLSWVDKTFLERSYERYFLCLPDVPWEDDPKQRVGPEERTKLHSRFQAMLARYQIDPIPLSGKIDQRIQTVLMVLRDLQ
jgi:nicotinamide riboside kinase